MATALSRANGVLHKKHSCPHAANHKPEDAGATCAAGPHQVTAHSWAVGRLYRPARRSLCVRRLHDSAAASSCCEGSPAPSCTPADIAAPPLDEYPPTYITAPGRVVAIGDIHGDLAKAVTALKVAGVLDGGPLPEDPECPPVWCGGNTMVVQLGDVLDRGDQEIAVVFLLRELDRQARLEGGAVYMLNGNHESLNISGKYRYTTPGGFRDSAVAAGLTPAQLSKPHFCTQARNRMYLPGGRMALELSRNPTVLIVNDTLFAHGGVLPFHVKYGLERINREVSAWMRGERRPDGSLVKPPVLAVEGGKNSRSVVWNRQFGLERFDNMFVRYNTCKELQSTLRMLGVRQLVVGHTVQEGGANCECNGRVWRIDVGMSRGVLNAVPQVLEITKEDGRQIVRLLRAPFEQQLAAAMAPMVSPAPCSCASGTGVVAGVANVEQIHLNTPHIDASGPCACRSELAMPLPMPVEGQVC